MPVPKAFDNLPPEIRRQLRKTDPPGWFRPMLATLTEKRFSREGWLFEPKFDGVRCLVFRRGRSVELLSRNEKLLNTKYPELVEALQELKPSSFIADGEIVAFDKGLTSFTRLQQRMQVQYPSTELQRAVPVSMYIFDLLYLDPYDLRGIPLRLRKQLLGDTLALAEPLRFTEHRETEGEAYFEEACRRHWEGVIAKNGDSTYVSGRSREWLKFKCVAEQEFVIGGYTDPEGQRIGFGALLVGYYERGKLKYAGKVGTGYDDALLRQLGKQLHALETHTNTFDSDLRPRSGVHWVKPKLVAQIGFTEWTSSGKLRHPRFLGFRDDKAASEVRREK
ncbi:MAG TPA: non-homologous end-joining DNA ligase [Bryobacteraceae bacterium]|nr:non-homologous end-joining DNA ligase [Bryobacteraceae bacterium]